MIWKRARGVSGGESHEAEGKEMSEREAMMLYETALNEAAVIASESVSKSFEASKRRTAEEFEEFLEKIGRGVGLESASDLDVIAFVQGWWLPAHLKNCRTMSGKGEKVASASSVKGVIQHLAKTYSMRGRRDQDNPAKQESVRSYCEGYRNRLHAEGVREKRAKVFKEGKVEDLIAHLEERIRESIRLTRCIQRMDLTAVLYLWESWCRGKDDVENCVRTRWTSRPGRPIPVGVRPFDKSQALISSCKVTDGVAL
jgi:hypothetical protein